MKNTMKKLLSLLLVSAMCVTCIPIFSADATTKTLDDWTLHGSAYYDSESDTYILTQNTTWQLGSMWLNEQISLDFELSLDYYSGNRNGADGLTVVFYENSNSNNFDVTPDIVGYAVDLDTYYNSGFSEPISANHISINKSLTNHLAWAELPESEDDSWHNLKISVVQQVCSVYVDGKLKFVYDTPYTNYGCLRILASTGASTNKHAVKNIRIDITPGNSSGNGDNVCSAGHDWDISADGNNYVCKVCGEQTTIEKGIPDDALEFNGHYYKVFTNTKTWKDAKKFCEDLGGHLATVTSIEEQSFIEKNIIRTNTEKRMFWLGGYCVDYRNHVWKWVTGEDFSYANWSRGEPSGGQDSLVMLGAHFSTRFGEWLDNPSEGCGPDYIIEYIGIICEWEPNENPGLGTDETSQILRGTYYGTYESSLLSVFIDEENGYGFISEITVEGNTYLVDPEFSREMDLLNNNEKYLNNEVVIHVRNGKIVDLKLIDELVFDLECSMTISDQKLTYIDKKYNKESIQLAVYAYAPCNPTNFSGDFNVLSNIPDLYAEIDSLMLTSSNADILTFNGEKTCEISLSPISITYGQSILLAEVTLDVNTDYRIPKNQLNEIISIAAVINGNKNNTAINDSVSYSINIDNLGKNKPSSSVADSDELNDSIKKAGKDLKRFIKNTEIVWGLDDILGLGNAFHDIFSDEELDAITAEMFANLIMAKAVEKEFGTKVVDKIFGFNSDWFKVNPTRSITITKTKETKEYGIVKVRFTCDFNELAYGSCYTGTIYYELFGENLSSEKTKTAQFYSADTSTFYDSMIKVANEMRPSVLDIIDGASSDTLDVLFDKTITEIAIEAGYSNIFDAALSSIKKVSKMLKADCPVDVYVYDSENTLVANIVNNEVVLSTENAKAEIVGDSKIVWLSDDSYTVEYRSLAEYNMTLTVKEYGDTDTLLRTVVIEDIPLAVGTDYTQSIDDTCLEEADYSLVSTAGNVIVPTSDSTTLHTHIPDGELEVIDVATCTEYGFKCALCTVCNEWCREIIPATGHEYQVVTTTATCTQNGKLMHTCSACADTYYDEIPATGHADEDKNGSCDFCDEVLELPTDPETPDEPTDDNTNCSCLCHSKNSFMHLIYTIVRFFWQLFGVNMDCACGAKHFDSYFFG